MRQEIPIVVLGPDGRPAAGASVYVRTDPAGTDATVYQARTGGSTFLNPLTSDAQGRVTGWLERGDYAGTITIAGLPPWVESFPIGSQNDGHIDLAEIPDGLITGAKIADGTITSPDIADGTITGADLAAAIKATGLYRIGTYAARPNANAVETGTIYRASDKGMEFVSDGTNWVWTGHADAVVSATKPSTPLEGQRWAYIAATGVRWEFVWRDAVSRWEPVDNVPLIATVAALSQLSGGPTAIPGLSLTVPFAGDWYPRLSAPSIQNTNASASNIAQVQLFKNGVNQPAFVAIAQPFAGASTWANAHGPDGLPLTCAAGDVLDGRSVASANQINFANLVLSLRPKALT